MKTIGIFFLAVGIVFSPNLLHAQTATLGSFNRIATPISSAPDSIVAVTAEAQGLSLVAPEDLPRSGTFWLITSNGVMAPLPCPLLDQNLPTYAITDNIFLVDGTGGQVAVNTRRLGMQASMSSTVDSALSAQQTAIVNLINQVQGAQFKQDFSMAMGMGVPTPGAGGDSGGGVSPNGLSVPLPDYGTNLWLELANVANGRMNGLIHNSAPLVPYTIYSKQDLLLPAWTTETTFYGSGITTNLTPFALPALERGILFLRAIAPIAPRIIGAGMSHNVVIRRDGTVWAWGGGSSGQLGNGQWSDTDSPVQVTGLSNIVALAAPPDGNFNLALDSIGKVWSWGEGDSGQLGRNDGHYSNTNLAALVPGISNIVAIAGGQSHALALKSDGTVWAWGDNSFGQLGDTNTYGRDYPARVTGLTNAIAIASGAYHCFALCANGTVQGWGYNGDGELGLGNTTDQPLPALVPALTNVVALSGGYFHSLALLANGTVKAWGDDSYGATGVGSSSTPVTVSALGNILVIACGGYHNLALDTNNNLFLWGNGWSDQLGDGSGNNFATPFQLTGISNVVAIAGGETSSMISTADGSLYVWGSSGSSQLARPSLMDLYASYSSDNSGLPDWWQMLYFGHLGVDPSADPDGDGRSNLVEYQDGTNPTNFDAPPTPDGLTVTQSAGSNNVTVTWNASPLTVSYYVIYRADYNYGTWQYDAAQAIGQVAGTVATSQMVARAAYFGVRPMDAQNNTLSFVDTGSIAGGDGNSVYTVQAVYPGGTSPVSAQAYVNSALPAALAPAQPITVNLVRNETGRWQLMFAGLPSDVQTIQLQWNNSTENIAPASLANGSYQIPDADVVNHLGDTVSVTATATNGTTSATVQVGTVANDAPYFVDGRRHLKQNLSFLIRGASRSQHYGIFLLDYRYSESATNFEEFSFLSHDSLYGVVPFAELDDLRPFAANYDLANYILDPSNYDQWYPPFSSYSPQYHQFVFQPNFATNIPAPPILTNATPFWIMAIGFSTASNPPYGYYPNTTDWGVSVSDFTNLFFLTASLQGGINNYFGLPYQAGCVIAMPAGEEINPANGMPVPITNVCHLLAGGDSVTVAHTSLDFAVGDYASWCLAPTLQPVDYYFAPLLNPNANPLDLPEVDEQPSPLPIDDAFAVTNQTPAVMFGSVGQPMILGGWAKYSIQGSSPTKYAYLGQYFTTNAFKVDASGNVTSTNTGIVSPYGEFFPTEPGPVAMVTMPDIDTGLQATGIVQVISLAMDANQDGTIDPTYNGPDTISATRPFKFWTDRNFDRTNYDADDSAIYEDDVQTANNPGTSIAEPDCNYSNVLANGYSYRAIPTKRDLEDFTRLWICGLTTNALAALPAGSTVTLNWGDFGSPNSGNPTIDLFAAADAAGSIGYQTNETVAAQQINTVQCPYIGRLAPGGSIQLNASQFNGWAGNHFIWCGVSTGTGKLNLTIADAHSNVLAQTSTYIQLVDIKQMYERWTLGENPSIAPTMFAQLATNDLPTGVSQSFRYSQPGDASTPYILYVHGWNMETWEKDRFAETAFKRLYWQGYQGRFGVFRWPTGFNFTGWKSVATDPDNFDNSEYQAWQSATGLLNKLNELNTQYPNHVYLLAHSMGNVVAGEALRLAGSSQVAKTYVASQAAVSAHTYDPSVANYSFTVNLGGFNIPFGPNTPNIYGNWFAGNSGGGAGQVISFYNVNDYALSRLHWQLDQLFKPDQDVLKNGNSWTYHYNGNASDPSPWNHFSKYNETLFYTMNFDIANVLTNRYEVMAYAAQSYTTALGATPATVHLTGSIDLTRSQNPRIWPTDSSQTPYGAHFWHSAQFRGDYAPMQGYWSELLGTEAFNLK